MQADLKDEHFVNCLVDNHCFSDAIMFLTHALGCKDGISWARQSVSLYDENLTINDNYLLSSTENWLNNPSDINRYCVLPKKCFSQSTPAVWVALAAYWSEGSIEKDTSVAHETPTNLVNDAIYSAIMLMMQEVKSEDKYRIYISIINNGIDSLINCRMN